MKFRKFFPVALALALVAGADSALAHGPRGRVGVYIGAPVVWGPVWGPGWYPPPYYYPPRVIVTQPAPPPVYVEQNPPAQQAYWYYCASATAYYPYVKECPEEWQKVLPEPEK